MLQKELGVLLTPPTGKEKAKDWKGLEILRELQIKFEDAERLVVCKSDHIYTEGAPLPIFVV